MAENFTNAFINYLKAGDKEITYSDSKTTGLRVRVTTAGTKTFYFYYRLRGKLKKMMLGRCSDIGVPEARKRAKQLHGQVLNGIDPAMEKAEKVREMKGEWILKDYLKEEYYPDIESLKSAEKIKRIINQSFKGWMNKGLTEIDKNLMRKFVRKEVKRGIKHTTINRHIIAMKTVLNHAVEGGDLAHSGLDKYKNLKTDRKSHAGRFLSDEEETRLLKVCEGSTDKFKVLVLLLLHTGIRPNEAKNLKWTDINFKLKLLTVRGEIAKSGQTRHISLRPEIKKTLSAFAELDSTGYVFKNDNGKPIVNTYAHWSRIRDEAKLENFRLYDLRHTFASHLIMKGAPPDSVRVLLGHASLDMTNRYTHLSPSHLADVINL